MKNCKKTTKIIASSILTAMLIGSAAAAVSAETVNAYAAPQSMALLSYDSIDGGKLRESRCEQLESLRRKTKTVKFINHGLYYA